MKRHAVAALSLSILAFVVPGQAAEVTLNLSGTFHDGGPEFELSLGETVIGAGVVDDGRPVGQIQPFRFEVPDVDLQASEPFRIRFLNDAYGGPDQDRNLHVHSLQVDQRSVAADEMRLLGADEEIDRAASGGHISLLRDAEIAEVPAPADGWLTDCEGEFAVTGYQNNEVAWPAGTVVDRIDELLELARSGSCAVTVRAYGSARGSEEANRRVSAGRAEAALAHLLEQGARFTRSKAIGMGETSQFGEDAENRRVIVEIHGAR